MQRRKFLQAAGLSATALVAQPLLAKESKKSTKRSDAIKPLTICTWNFHRATAKSWEVISNGGTALDAVEQGVMVEESDLSNQTVGKGGRQARSEAERDMGRGRRYRRKYQGGIVSRP